MLDGESGLGGMIGAGWGCFIFMVGRFGGGWDSGLDIEFGSFLFWVVLRSVGLGLDGGCFVGFFIWFEDGLCG